MGEWILFKSGEDKDIDMMLSETEVYLDNVCIRFLTIGFILILIGIAVFSLIYIINKLSIYLLMGYGIILIGCVVILVGIFYPIKSVPAYELFCGYGTRRIIKTTPEQDQIEICKAKSELEQLIKGKCSKTKAEQNNLKAMIENCKE